MIPDRIIEQGTLTTTGSRSAVEVRLPWYRALPGSCISGASLTIDGTPAPAESLRWQMNGREFTFDELRTNTEEWWLSIPEEMRPHKDQPFYHLLAENSESEYVAYVSEQNLLPDESGEPIRHSQVAEIFVKDKSGSYRPRNPSLN